MQDSILIIDDEQDMLRLLERTLAPELNAEIKTASRSEEALKLLSSRDFDLIVSDIKMPGFDGLELLKIIKDINPNQTIVMMTAYGDIEMVIHAMKSGAYDFITKPFDHEALVMRLSKAMERARLLKENKRLNRDCSENEVLKRLVGESPAMKKVFETIRMVAQTDVTILITGESGTGKNMVSKAIHSLSPRKSNDFVTVNCPTIPENILESELFGYKKGAFTHAVKNKKGLFQEADKGTIFLDEIGEISSSIQTKLLRVLQDKEIKPLGDNEVIKVDTRIIASTNQDLHSLVKQGIFREDLFYRLNVVSIEMPPLRERTKDIPLIANHLLEKHCKELNKPFKIISPELMDLFLSNPWEGNVRELENVITRGIIYSQTNEITAFDAGFKSGKTFSSISAEPDYSDMNYREAKENNLKEFNLKIIGERLRNTKGNVSEAARQLGLERQGLQKIMKRYNILPDDYRG